jgi:hypothetical protein
VYRILGIAVALGIAYVDNSWIWAGGGFLGGSASLRVFPEAGLSIAMLDNLTDGPSSRLVTDVVADIFIRAGRPHSRPGTYEKF